MEGHQGGCSGQPERMGERACPMTRGCVQPMVVGCSGFAAPRRYDPGCSVEVPRCSLRRRHGYQMHRHYRGDCRRAVSGGAAATQLRCDSGCFAGAPMCCHPLDLHPSGAPVGVAHRLCPQQTGQWTAVVVDRTPTLSHPLPLRHRPRHLNRRRLHLGGSLAVGGRVPEREPSCSAAPRRRRVPRADVASPPVDSALAVAAASAAGAPCWGARWHGPQAPGGSGSASVEPAVVTFASPAPDRVGDARRGKAAVPLRAPGVPGSGAPVPGSGAAVPGSGAAVPGCGAPVPGCGAPVPGCGAPVPAVVLISAAPGSGWHCGAGSAVWPAYAAGSATHG